MVKNIAIVSLSSGTIGEAFAAHEVEIGIRRLKEYGLNVIMMPHAQKGIEYVKNHPEDRAKDLLQAFSDDSIDMILCAIGGDDTYRLPYLFEHKELQKALNKKIFLGFSDTTVNHLMLHKLGLNTFYGQSFLADICEMDHEMLPYTATYFEELIRTGKIAKIEPSDVWYEERTDFSRAAVGTERISHKEERGYELLQGKKVFEGRLLGGCLESLYDILTTTRYADEQAVCEKYGLFPAKEEWTGKILFVETCEEKPQPALFEKELEALKDRGVFDVVAGVIVGKPQDEAFYEEYKDIWKKTVNNDQLPIVYNVNFGHATPRCAMQYGAMARVDMEKKVIIFHKPIDR